MLLRRFTILCLLIVGLATIASVFVYQKYRQNRDNPVVGPFAASQTVKPAVQQ